VSATADVVVRGAAFHFPESVLPTATLIQREAPHRIFDLRERRRMGVKYVRVAGPDDTPSSLAIAAAKKALAGANLEADQLDMVVSVACTPADYDMWSLPAKVAKELGASKAQCFGIGDSGCAAAFAALRVIFPLMEAPGGPKRVLLVAGCVTPGGHFFPPATIFGDGAGALVLERVEQGSDHSFPRIVRVEYHSDVQYVDAFGPGAGSGLLRNKGSLERADWTLKVHDDDAMQHLIDHGAELSADLIKKALARQGWTPSDLRWLIPDNVATIIGIDLGGILELPEDRVLTENCMRYGHAWVVDLFVNLTTILDERPLEPNEKVACVGVGVGAHWGVVLLEK
jgi:3-oxoacyl-[acyl-carrier-protein] synthase III